MITCPCCGGSGMLEVDPPVPLTRQQFLIYDIVRRAKMAGISCEVLCDRVYADDADGGPENAGNVVRLQIWRANHRLAIAGVRIAASSRGRGSVYTLKREDGKWIS